MHAEPPVEPSSPAPRPPAARWQPPVYPGESTAPSIPFDVQDVWRGHVAKFLASGLPGCERRAIRVLHEVSGVRLSKAGLEAFVRGTSLGACVAVRAKRPTLAQRLRSRPVVLALALLVTVAAFWLSRR